MVKVLIVYYSLSGNTKAAAEEVAEGIKSSGAKSIIREGFEASPDDLLNCDAIAVGTPDYFSYMAGGVKDFFDRSFYPTQDKVTGKPCAIFITHGGGGRAVDSVKSICSTFKFKLISEPVSVNNRPDKDASVKLRELGKNLVNACKKE
jgi:flavorubredoxin